MLDLGTVKPGSTIRIPFSTFDKDDGSSLTMTNFAVADILVYKDGSTTERASTAGFTATTDFDSKTGKHFIIIDLADNTTAGFFAAGSEYHVAIDSVTVDAVTTGGWAARFKIGYQGAILDTTIATLSSQTSFTLTAGPAEDDALNGHWLIIHDVASAVQFGKALILDYTGSTKTVTLVAGTTFTAAASDNVSVMDMAPLQPTTLGRTLDVSATGEAGLDFDNIKAATGATTLTNITVPIVTTVGTLTTYTGNTPQTGDAYATVNSGTHGNAALKTLIDAVDNFVDTEIADIQSRLPSSAAATNMTTVFATDFATNYDTTNDLWNAKVMKWGGSASQTIATDDDGFPTVSMYKFYDSVFDGYAVFPIGANRNVKADLCDINGTAITGTGTQVAAAFLAQYNVAAPVFTNASVNQTGDSFARIGATGSGLTSLAPSATALSTSQWSNTRAGYLDNLSAGAVATAAALDAVDNFVDTEIADIQSRLPSSAAATNMTMVFATDFATNYDTSNDMWAVRVSRWGSAASQTIEVDDGGRPVVSMLNFYDSVFDGFVNFPIGENRNVKVDLRDINGSSIAGTSTQVYDAFLAQYNVASPAFTNASVNQTANHTTNIAAIKAKTDNLPSSPAAVGSAMTLADGAITDAKFTIPTLTGPASGPVGFITQLWRRFFKRATKSATDIKTYADNGTTVVTTQTISTSGDDETQGAAS